MNILYLNSHDTGRYIQPYGYAVETPHLQRLAEEGTLFRDAHCAAPTCSPSRAGLLTGQSAHGSGMVGLAHRGGKLLQPERHLAHFLKSRGYETVKAGFTHVGNDHAAHGYTVIGNNDFKDSEATTRFAVDFLRHRPADGRPFYLDVGYLETHRVGDGYSQEHDSPKDGDGDPGYVMPPPVFADTPETRRDWLDYRHSVERLDRHYGRILDALEAAGLADDTLVLATTDHGLPKPEMKCQLTHHGTGVLQIIRFPKGLGRGQVIDALVSHLDFYPTVCELLGAAAPEWLEGHSLLPLVRGEAEAIREDLRAEVTFHAAFEPKRSVRTKRWNYIRNFAAPHATVMPNCDAGLSKTHRMEAGMKERITPAEELYDLVFDPQERCNLLEKKSLAPVHREAYEDLKQRLDAWMRATDDPLLSDDPAVMPLPHKVNTWEQDHPGPGSTEWDPAEWERVRIVGAG